MFIKLENGKIMNLKRTNKISVKTTDEGAVIEYLLDNDEVILDRFEDKESADAAFGEINTDGFITTQEGQMVTKNKIKNIKIDPENPLAVEYEVFGSAPVKVEFEDEDSAKSELEKVEKELEENSPVPPKPVDPEITSITVSPEVGLTAPVSANAKVASLSAEGGTPELTYALAGGKDDAKFQIKGTEVQAKSELDKGTYTIKVKVTDSKGKEKTSNDITITVDYKIYDITEVFKVRGDEEQTFNKQIKELQQNIAYENTGKGKGKVTGTLLWVTGYTNPAYEEGNIFSLHIDNTKLPKGTVKVVWGTSEASPDTKDWNVNLKVNDKDDKTFKIKVNDDIVYTLDCSTLTLTPKD